jgi:hypothetical protein
MRAFAAIIAGIVAGVAALLGISFLGNLIFPVPVDATIRDPIEQAAAALPNAPAGLLAAFVLAWLLTGLVGAWVAKLISGSGAIAWTVAGLLTLLIVGNMFVMPFPGWMQIACVAAPLIGGLIGNHMARARVAPLPPEAAATTDA